MFNLQEDQFWSFINGGNERNQNFLNLYPPIKHIRFVKYFQNLNLYYTFVRLLFNSIIG